MRKKSSNSVGLFQGKPTYLVILFFLLAALLASVGIAVTIGAVNLSVGDVYRVILHHLFGVGDSATYGAGAIHDVVWLIRLPRLLLALLVGMALSVCGVVMQAVVKNLLADPFVLGISSGASLGSTLAIFAGVGVFIGKNAVGAAAFLGAFGVALAVTGLANVGGRPNTTKLLLAGMALSAVCSAFSNFIVYTSNDKDALQTVSYWLLGSLAGANWENLIVIGPFILLGTVFFWTQARTLNLMLLGDETAVTLGTNMHRWRLIYLLVSSAMIGLVVFCSGIIGFVGLVIPHVTRMLFGTDHKKMIPLSALLGAVFLIWADVLCRVILRGGELPIGILTSIIGAPCFVFLMVRRKYGFGGTER